MPYRGQTQELRYISGKAIWVLQTRCNPPNRSAMAPQ